jgi:hypothetical protein
MNPRIVHIAVAASAGLSLLLAGCGSDGDASSASSSTEQPSQSPSATPTRPSPSPSPSPVSPPGPVDPDRPPGALDLGEAAALDGISVTATSVEWVTPADGIGVTGFFYLGVQMSFTNTSSGPQEVFPSEQVRLENPYVATVGAQTVDVNEGDTVPWGAFRPGTTVSGYVVFALPDRHAAIEGFGIYFEDFTGEEIVWWPGTPA